MNGNDYEPPLGDFQPADTVEDREAMLEAWLGSDERRDLRRLLAWAYSKLSRASFSKQEDALALDEIKLMLMEAA